MNAHALPRVYAPYAALFAQFDAPMMSVLGGVLRALAPSLTQVGTFENQNDGEFTGYDGLENRGSLANLLESEWLLRELDADDFVRRIAEAEVLFRRRNFANAGKQSTLAVILDCGPWMLGRNRLIALAALFYLAIRAEQTNAQLHWIVPGTADNTWQKTLDRESIQTFLGRVVQTELTPKRVDFLLGKMSPEAKTDVWYVGAAQTDQITDHPAFCASFLLQSVYGARHDIEIDVKVRQRRLARLPVTFESDATCVAALRRPFQPAPRDGKSADTKIKREPLFTTLPYQTGWLLDRLNKAVLVRLREGVLWQPLLAAEQKDGAWLPVADDDLLLGLHVARNRSASALIATPDAPVNADGEMDCQLTLLRIDLRSKTAAPQVLGRCNATIKPAQFPPHALGNLHVSDVVVLVQADGQHMRFTIEKNGELKHYPQKHSRVLWCDSNYMTHIGTGAKKHITVQNMNKHQNMQSHPLESSEYAFETRPRHIIYSPSDHTLLIGTQGDAYDVFSKSPKRKLTVPRQVTLIHLSNAWRALAWDDEKQSLAQFQCYRQDPVLRSFGQYDGPRVDLPRCCPLSSNTFGMHYDDADQPAIFCPIHLTRDWATATKINIPDAIAQARTVWLKP